MLEVTLSHAFAGFSLEVEFRAGPGVTALFGRSGAGKTTIAQAVAGLLRPDAGRIVLGGEVLVDTARGLWLPPHRRRLGYVFQDARLFPHMTVRQNLDYGRRFAPRPPDAAEAARIVDLLGIAPLLERRPAALSGGEKSRVALGRALLSAPRGLVMDEPLAALDEPRKAEILPYVERLRDGLGLPILYVSHSVAEVARLADTLVLVDGGRVVASGPAGALLSDPALGGSFGLRELGAVVTARVAAQEPEDGLTRLILAGSPVWLPRVEAAAGSLLRLRILAQDVMVATARPEGISALNILPATVAGLHGGQGPGVVVRLALGAVGPGAETDEALLARITRRSAEALALRPGQPVFAVLKAVSVARENVGGG